MSVADKYFIFLNLNLSEYFYCLHRKHSVFLHLELIIIITDDTQRYQRVQTKRDKESRYRDGQREITDRRESGDWGGCLLIP